MKRCTRQFNAVRVQLEGKIDSVIKQREKRLISLGSLIESTKEKIATLEKKGKKRLLLHKKKRKLHHLEHKQAALLEDKKKGVVRLCFGSQKLFRAQQNLEKNGYSSHEEWKEDWIRSRNSSFFVMGSKDETAGNQTCKATICEDGTFTLLLRLPDALAHGEEKYLVIEKVRFAYGHETIVAALKSCQKRQELKSKKDPAYTHYGQAISYRFKLGKKNRWYIFASTSLQTPEVCTDKKRGAVGIDINANQIALVETDPLGNPIYTETIPLNTYGKSPDQSEALIGDAAAKIVAHAKKVKKPLVLEELDFSEKKKSLKEMKNTSYARMLSSFVYRKTIDMTQSRGYRSGVEVISVDPSFTSVIGRIKYALRYGLTIHESAALCIARRGSGFSEKIPSRLDRIPTGEGDFIALTPPVRKCAEHKKSSWRKLSKKLKAELAAHFWAKKKDSICRRASRAA